MIDDTILSGGQSIKQSVTDGNVSTQGPGKSSTQGTTHTSQDTTHVSKQETTYTSTQRTVQDCRIDTSVSADHIQQAGTEKTTEDTPHTTTLPAGENIRESMTDQIGWESTRKFEFQSSTGLNSSHHVISIESSVQHGEELTKHVLDATILPGGESAPKPVSSVAWESTHEVGRASTQEIVYTPAELTLENSNNWAASESVRESSESKMVRKSIRNIFHSSPKYTDVNGFNNGAF